MTATDAERALRLDQHFDALLSRDEDGGRRSEVGGREADDADTMATLRSVAALVVRPVPDSAFVQRLREELIGSDAVLPRRVFPPPRVIPHHHVILSVSEESRLHRDGLSNDPRSFVPQDDSEWWRDDTGGSQNDTRFVHASLPLSSRNGYLEHSESLPGRLSPLWWQRWELAAALLVIAVLGGYLALANLGRTIPPLSRLSAITAQSEGTVPVELRIGAIGIDAPIEAVQAFPDDMVTPWAGDIWATGWQDGGPALITEPSDPFTVAWLDDSAAPGEGGNVVLYGHLDYWDTAHAVFWDLKELSNGDRIELTGENDAVFTYRVEWSRRYPIDVDAAEQREILGPTNGESLTLITSAGEFNEQTGLYPEVLVVRAVQADFAPTPNRGAMPVRLHIEAIGLDTLIGPREAPATMPFVPVGDSLISPKELDDDWILIPPDSDPSTVAWRDESAALGAGSNVVLEGRFDHSWTKPAVFWSLKDLKPGDPIEVYGLDRTVTTYEVDWLRRFPAAADPRQRLDVLGPTATENLTLITNAGERDRMSGLYQEVLVVRAHLVGTERLSVLAMPGPADCRPTPLPVDALEAVATVVAKPRQAPTPTPLNELIGEPADDKTIEAVIVAETELVACLNANDPLRAYALYTANGLARLLQYIGQPIDAIYEWTPDFSHLAAPATPVPTAEQRALLAVEDVRVLPDGRVAALVTIGPHGTDMLGIPAGIPVVHVFQPGDRYLIDEFYVPLLMGTPTP